MKLGTKLQIGTVLTVELIFLGCTVLFSYAFWNAICDNTLASCIGAEGPNPKHPITTFLLLSIIRPFTFTPLTFFAVLAGKAFGTIPGMLLTAVSGFVSSIVIFLLAKYVGHHFVKPWLLKNLPDTWNFLRSQDYKIVFFTRLLPVLPFDFVTLVFGLLNFRGRSVYWATFLGVMPEAYFVAHLADPQKSLLRSMMMVMLTVAILGGVVEFLVRKKGSSLWLGLKAMYRELRYEVQQNNEIVKRNTFDKKKPPILILYGFFSTRRALTALEERLEELGFEVMTFNQGGLFNAFFTRSIVETAVFIDKKIKRQMERHDFKKIPIVAHSKGGLVALWWLLKLGGQQFCDTVITMGVPFKGTWLTLFPLMTPLGLLWRDIWEMRPGSAFLKELHKTPIPDNLRIYCMYSENDKVTPAEHGIFMSEHYLGHVIPVPMHQMSHFDYLLKKKTAKVLADILMGANPK